MKKQILRLLAAILALTALFSLSSCASSDKPDGSGQAAQGDLADTDGTEQYAAKLEYYSSLLVELQDKLLDEKEKNYIAASEYRTQISELETTISQLSAKIEDMNSKNKDDKPSFPTASTKSDFLYTVDGGTATIILYNGSDGAVTVPDSIDGYSVVKIGEGAFKDSSVVNVTLPDTVREIDWFAFSGCVNLKEITIPASVTSVGYGAFDYCTARPRIICQKGSYIEAYAASWGMAFESK